MVLLRRTSKGQGPRFVGGGCRGVVWRSCVLECRLCVLLPTTPFLFPCDTPEAPSLTWFYNPSRRLTESCRLKSNRIIIHSLAIMSSRRPVRPTIQQSQPSPPTSGPKKTLWQSYACKACPLNSVANFTLNLRFYPSRQHYHHAHAWASQEPWQSLDA